MDFQIKHRESFSVCGYCVETSLKTCGADIGKLFEQFESSREKLSRIFGARKDFYGLMWKTGGDRYCYLLGVEANAENTALPDLVYRHVPPAEYAVAHVPHARSAVEAWTEYYYQTLPEAGYTPNAGHGFDFEYYPGGNNCDYELWTPVVKTEPQKQRP